MSLEALAKDMGVDISEEGITSIAVIVENHEETIQLHKPIPTLTIKLGSCFDMPGRTSITRIIIGSTSQSTTVDLPDIGLPSYKPVVNGYQLQCSQLEDFEDLHVPVEINLDSGKWIISISMNDPQGRVEVQSRGRILLRNHTLYRCITLKAKRTNKQIELCFGSQPLSRA